MTTGWIPIERKFLGLERGRATFDWDFREESLTFSGQAVYSWNDLVGARRAVLLGQPGSGKSGECQQQVHKLRRERHHAFYLRLEALESDGLEGSLSIADSLKYLEWRRTNDEAVFLLDSVDEARLHGSSLERSLRRFAREVRDDLGRVSIVVTCRPQDWRGETDLATFNAEVPALSVERSADPSDPETYAPGVAAPDLARDRTSTTPILTVSLLGLSTAQVREFATALGVSDPDNFCDAIDVAEAWSIAARPYDLIDLIHLWKAERRLGSPGELLERQVGRFLEETAPDRSLAFSISQKRAGVERLAASMELGRRPAIRVSAGIPEAGDTSLLPAELFPDYDPDFVPAILAARIFDPESVGKVRFHHRKTREFLAAHWFHRLLINGTSRKSVEAILFRPTVGSRRVTPPSLRPTVGWLASLNENIARSAVHWAPDALLLEGDPSRLSVPLRQQALERWIDASEGGRLTLERLDDAQLRRFADPALAPLIIQKLSSPDLTDRSKQTLLALIDAGKLTDGVPVAMRLALDAHQSWTVRDQALDLVLDIGSSIQKSELADGVLAGGGISTWFAANLIRALLGKELAATRLSDLLDKSRQSQADDDYINDHRADVVETWIKRSVDETQVREVAIALADRLLRPPLKDEYVGRPLNRAQRQFYSATSAAAVRLVQWGNDDDLVLRLVELAVSGENRYKSSDHSIRRDIPEFFERSDIRERLFTRALAYVPRESTNYFYLARRAFTVIGDGQPEDFRWLEPMFLDRADREQAKVAFAAAYLLVRDQPEALRDLGTSVRADGELRDLFRSYSRAGSSAKIERRISAHHARVEKQRARRTAKRKAAFAASMRTLQKEVGNIESGKAEGALIWARNWASREDSEQKPSPAKYSDLTSEMLQSTFGTDLGNSLAMGYRTYWRTKEPPSPADFAPNSTPYAAVIGLVGLNIEYAQEPGFIHNLSVDEAARATSYAVWELNGFPDWFPSLVNAHPEAVVTELLRHIRHELAYVPEGDWHPWVLYRLSYGDFATAQAVSSTLGQELQGAHGSSPAAVRAALRTVLATSSFPDSLAATLQVNFEKAVGIERKTVWLAGLMRVDAQGASVLLEGYLGSKSKKDRRARAVRLAAEVVGLHGLSGGGLPTDFLQPAAARKLLPIFAQHLPIGGQRSRSGWIGPEEEAARFRDLLLNAVAEAPGDDSVQLLSQMAAEEPHKATKEYLLGLAEHRARSDAESETWTAAQVVAFEREALIPSRSTLELARRVAEFLDDVGEEIECWEEFPTAAWKTAEEETHVSELVLDQLRHRNRRNWSITREEEVKNLKRTDLRVREGSAGPVAVEIKIADRWSIEELKSSLTNQLVGQYMLGEKNSAGVFLVVTQGSDDTTSPSRRKLDVDYDAVVRELTDLAAAESARLGPAKVVHFRILKAHGAAGQRLRKKRTGSKSKGR